MAMWRDFGLGLLASSVMAFSGMAEAQVRTIRDTVGPAEIPPASFAADRYVDSAGCIFLRAGVGGATRWVPRVNRDRTLVCGQTPTVIAAVPTGSPVAEAPDPVVEAPSTPRRAPAAEIPARRVAELPDTARPRAPRPAAPRPSVPAIAAAPGFALPVPLGCASTEAAARFLADTAACSAVLDGRGRAGPGGPMPQGQVIVAVATPPGAVRVNPYAASPRRAAGQPPLVVDAPVRAAKPIPRRAAAAARLAARDVVVSSRGAVLVPAARATFGIPTPPPGYRAAWDDGRLNPYRGPQSLEGDYQTRGIWTSTVPRRLRPVVYVRR